MTIIFWTMMALMVIALIMSGVLIGSLILLVNGLRDRVVRLETLTRHGPPGITIEF